MRIQRLILAMFVVSGLGSAASAADDNKKLIVGKWVVSKAAEASVPAGTTVEFSKDGKIKMISKKDGKDESREGTYTVDGNALTLMMKRDGEERTVKITIKKLSETELTVEGPDGKDASFKKK